jgi:hypothetical protein
MVEILALEQTVLILIGSLDTLSYPENREKFPVLLFEEQLKTIEECECVLYLDSPDDVSNKIVGFTRGGT